MMSIMWRVDNIIISALKFEKVNQVSMKIMTVKLMLDDKTLTVMFVCRYIINMSWVLDIVGVFSRYLDWLLTYLLIIITFNLVII